MESSPGSWRGGTAANRVSRFAIHPHRCPVETDRDRKSNSSGFHGSVDDQSLSPRIVLRQIFAVIRDVLFHDSSPFARCG